MIHCIFNTLRAVPAHLNHSDVVHSLSYRSVRLVVPYIMKSYIIPPPGSSILRAPTGGHVTGKSQENLNGKGPSPLLVHASQCLAFTPVLQRPPHSPATAQSTELASHSTAALPSRLLSTRLEPATANLTGLHRQPSNEPPRTSPRNPFRSRVRRRHTYTPPTSASSSIAQLFRPQSIHSDSVVQPLHQ